MAKRRRSRQFKYSSQVIDIEEARAKRRERLEKQREIGAQNRTAMGKEAFRRRVKRNKIRRRALYLVVLFFITIIAITSVIRIVNLKVQQGELNKEHQDMVVRQQVLVEELKHLNDPAYIEEQARGQLRLMMPGEKIYVFPNETSDTPKNKKANED